MAARIRTYQIILLIFVIVFSIYVWIAKPVPTANYSANNWATMSIEIGASVLTLVAIITAIALGNENSRRIEFNDNLNAFVNKVEEKKSLNPDKSFNELYDSSKEKILKIIDSTPPLRYSESVIGILGFYFFLTSALYAILGGSFQLTVAFFLYGIAMLIGYIFYVLEEFRIADRYSHVKKKSGSLSLLAAKINGVPYNLSVEKQQTSVTINHKIERMEFKLRFKGEARNGLLHATVKCLNGAVSFIPESNTYLANFGFANDYFLVLLEREFDTGILQINGEKDFLFELLLRNQKGSEVNPLIAKAFVERLGEQEIFKHCSLGNDVKINVIELRIYEDPLYKPNFKRRELDCITIKIVEP